MNNAQNRKSESLLIVAQKQENTIRTNYVKARIETMQQNIRCRLCGNRDEMIINECSKSGQKELGKTIHWELCKILKFPYSVK